MKMPKVLLVWTLLLLPGCLRSSSAVRCEDIGVPDGPNGMCVCPEGYRVDDDADYCIEIDAGVAEDQSPRSDPDASDEDPDPHGRPQDDGEDEDAAASTTKPTVDGGDVVVPDGKEGSDAATATTSAVDGAVVVPDGKEGSDAGGGPQDAEVADVGVDAAVVVPACQVDDDCGESSNVCGARQCSADQRCETVYAAAGDPCPGGDGYCTGRGSLSSCVECTDDVHCPGEHCVGSRCVECVSDGDCPTTDECTPQGECWAKCGNGRLNAGEECDPAMEPHACSDRCESKNWGTYCQGSSWKCTGGLTCMPPENYCAEPCTADADCPDSRYICEEGFCAFPCSTDDDCPGTDDGLEVDLLCFGTCVPSLL